MNFPAATILTLLALAGPSGEWIDDPSAVPLRQSETRSGERYRILADFNNDGIKDMALSYDTSMFGNAGGHFSVYIANGEGKFREHGEVFAHPLAIALENSWRGNRVWVYLHGSSSSGEFGYYEISDEGVSDLECITLWTGSGGTTLGNAIYDAVFRNLEYYLRIERSETKDGTVNWNELRSWGPFGEQPTKSSGSDSQAPETECEPESKEG